MPQTKTLLVALAALGVACTPKAARGPLAAPTGHDGSTEGTPDRAADSVRADAARPVTGPSGILEALQNGDRACYVLLTTDAGELSIEGDFALCPGGSRDATALLGKRVTWTTEKAAVQAASCEGNPDCSDSETIDVIDTLTPIP